MTALDIILLACFAPAIWNGFRKGLISQLLGLASLIISIWVSFHFATPIAAWLNTWIEVSPVALKVAAYVIIFIAIAIGMNFLRVLLEKVIKFVMLDWVNKICGMVLAIIGTAIVLGVIIMLFNSLNVNFHIVEEERLATSQVYQFLKGFAYGLFPYMKEMMLL
ncbi:MAG: CvpA family protein [Bacteroidales bacterium]|nr:CvpA family protein [Bacteroidales bacterium]